MTHRLHHRWCIGSALVLLVLLASTASGEREREGVCRGPLPIGDAEGAVFLAEPILMETPIGELPIPEVERSKLARWVDQQRRPEAWSHFFAGGRVPSCVGRFASLQAGADPDAVPLPQALADSEVVLRGQVVGVVPGYDAHRSSVAELATVRVEEIVRASAASPPLEAGDEIHVLFRGGEVRVGGTEICHRPRAGFYRPVRADRILVAGHPRGRATPLFVGGYVFPVEDDGVLQQPYSSVEQEPGRYTLTALRRSLEHAGR